MSRRSVYGWVAAGLMAALLYLAPINLRGLVSADEPRYADVARAMAESGDWVTPRLWGEPWFEKPVLLYWMGAAAHKLGIREHTRVPAALLSLCFLVYFFRAVSKAFGRESAVSASLILATSAGWVAYSDAGIFDLPLTAIVSAALLCLLRWVDDSEATDRGLPWFGALLGLSVLAKGLVGPAVAALALLPVLWARPRRIVDLLHWRVVGPFAFVALPWYVLCYSRNGAAFVDEFLWKHHVERFYSDSLQHAQPFWYYAPVLVGFLLPWTPFLFKLDLRALLAEPKTRFLLAWAIGPFLFFSVSVNKLPAYVLPVLPPLAILLGLRLQQPTTRWVTRLSMLLLALVPVAIAILPAALASGITAAWVGWRFEQIGLPAILALAVVAASLLVLHRFHNPVAAVATTAALLLSLLKIGTYAEIDRVAGTRSFYLSEPHAVEACLGEVRRHTQYGILYYSKARIERCSEVLKPYQIVGDPPKIIESP